MSGVFSTEVTDSRDGANGPIHVANEPFRHEADQTLYTNLQRGALVENGARPLFGERKVDATTGKLGDYEWLSYAEVINQTSWLATAMASELKLKRQECVGVFAKNRVEWGLVEHAANRMAYTLVPLYDTLGPQAVPFILNQTEMRVVFCAKQQLKIMEECVHHCTHIEQIVVFEALDEADKAGFSDVKVQIWTMEELVATAKANHAAPLPADAPTPEDLCTICYTSGTTGNPKGAMLSHGNVMSAVQAIHQFVQMSPEDVHISYLPLAHVFERAVQVLLIRAGGAIGFYQGDVMKLTEDLAILKPTIFPSVPRLLNRIFDKVMLGVSHAPTVKRVLFEQAYASKKYYLDNGGHLTHRFWDALVFDKLKALLGGHVRLIVTGSAPLANEVKDFYQIVFGCPFIEGYGLTECVAAATASHASIPNGNNVGVPYPGVQVRLQDVPDMNYTSDDQPRPRGEVLVKGPCVFKGYFKAPEQTAEMLDADGWLHTGDIGAWNADGTLSIIDRKKNIFKLSQGEYVAPEKIEGVYQQSAFVQQMFVHGDSLQSFLVGVVVPDPDAAKKWQEENGKADVSLAELCANDAEFKAAVAKDMLDKAHMNKLFGFEMVKKMHLHPEAFTAEQNLVTPTFKLKRPQLQKHFEKQITAMYAQH
ncbi:TPA: hypothetical protein N0F65_003357 [Lagenidium giganteum]|uniref:Long-chain-fatty-acid--CoA ligase n=1 Tax=Lagenidium giganteum TaxID=4803 RepID=A0AAV2ZF28_9STRA|nr:TPA: hypothetical protein N0F65_003357 [Lagenidium giganteum]